MAQKSMMAESRLKSRSQNLTEVVTWCSVG